MRDALKIAALSLLSVIVLYAAAAFISMEPAPRHWDSLGRLWLVCLWVMLHFPIAWVVKGLP